MVFYCYLLIAIYVFMNGVMLGIEYGEVGGYDQVTVLRILGIGAAIFLPFLPFIIYVLRASA